MYLIMVDKCNKMYSTPSNSKKHSGSGLHCVFIKNLLQNTNTGTNNNNNCESLCVCVIKTNSLTHSLTNSCYTHNPNLHAHTHPPCVSIPERESRPESHSSPTLHPAYCSSTETALLYSMCRQAGRQARHRGAYLWIPSHDTPSVHQSGQAK